jgi:hypothetical protein
MSVNVTEITDEETAKIAGILEAKWARKVQDMQKLEKELKSVTIQLSSARKEAEYWHGRCLEAEERGDVHWASADYMQQQWDALFAQAFEVREAVKTGIIPQKLLAAQRTQQ